MGLDAREELALQSVTHCKQKLPSPFCHSDTICNFKLSFRERDEGGRASVITLMRPFPGSYQGIASECRGIEMDALIKLVILCFFLSFSSFLIRGLKPMDPWGSIRHESSTERFCLQQG